MKPNIHLKEFLLLTFIFIASTVIGTLSHELGHIAVAKYKGYKTSLHYASMNYDTRDFMNNYREIYVNFQQKKISEAEFLCQSKTYSQKLHDDGLYISIGGPAQTILTGTLGLLILLWRKRLIQANGLKFGDWTAIFLTLFWLREPFNLCGALLLGLIQHKTDYFAGSNDEFRITKILQLPPGSIAITLGILGFAVASYVVFRIIPRDKRLTFICGGLCGGLSGFYLWIILLGPKLMP